MNMESPFKDMLHTNTAPSDADCQTIHDFLVGPREEIAVLTDEIVATEALLDKLNQKRAVLKEFVAVHLALVSPFRRLPADVMQEIFVACLPSHRNSTIAEQDAPLLLCHICRAWRNLALSMPRLWASLHIVVPHNDRIPWINDTTNTWLSRSGALPLSISIASLSKKPREYILLRTLIGFSLRWEHITFIFCTYESLNPLASLSPADVPSLRTVTIKGLSGTSRAEWSNVGFLANPRVHSVSFTASGENVLFIPLRWERLRRLSIRGSEISSDTSLDILQKCPLLETCYLIVTCGKKSPETPYRLEHMRNLSVFDKGSKLFEYIIAPKLVWKASAIPAPWAIS
ncbi:hypothetical protein DFH07DRAFT_162317 [Mycena maculata]|uniref:F-box domain-containing protein n=1 Tax=Mycena maculata TaxID=230809 RepID=A0AAD7HZR4_9AGAR|nr:hypothetical protein DFH07DRAFT_162317 [Mycena maculata]